MSCSLLKTAPNDGKQPVSETSVLRNAGLGKRAPTIAVWRAQGIKFIQLAAAGERLSY